MSTSTPLIAEHEITLADQSQEIRYLAAILSNEFPDSSENRVLQALIFSDRQGCTERSHLLESARKYLLGPAQ